MSEPRTEAGRLFLDAIAGLTTDNEEAARATILAIEAEAALPPSGDLIDLLSRASNRLDLYQTHDEDCPRPIAGAQCPCSHGQLMREIDAALTETEPRP